MASTYSPSLRLELMATGDQSGTWGDTTNTNLGTLLEQSITGYLSKAMADTDQTLTSLNGASDEARNMVVEATGALTAGRNMVVPTAEKVYLIKNSTTGGFAVTVKTSAGTGVAVPMNGSRWVYCDGTNVVDGMSGPLTPTTSDSAALGTSALMWSDLFLASGGVINWNNGALTLTQATETLTQTFTDAGATVGPVYDLYRDSSTPAVNDILGRVAFNGEDSAGNKQEYASIEAIISDPTTTAEDGDLDMYATVAGTRRRLFSINSTQALYGRPLPTIANGTDAINDINFAAGAASDLSTTATGLMWVACAAMVKQLDANWAVGTNQGMRYSGAAITDTTYHLWACWTDAGVQDYYADPSAVQATVLGHLQAEAGGSAYTHLRRVASIMRDAGAIRLFTQIGDTFKLNSLVTTTSAANPGASAVTRILAVPAGFAFEAIFIAGLTNSASGVTPLALFSSFTETDEVPTTLGGAQLGPNANVAGYTYAASAELRIITNTASEIRSRLSASDASVTIGIKTKGWVDTRGRLG